MKTKQLLTLLALPLAVGSIHAAVIEINDYTLVPDGTNYGSSSHYTSTEVVNTDISAAAGGTIINGTRPIAFMVATYSFGADTSAEINLNMGNSMSVPVDRLGVRVTSAGIGGSTGDGSDDSTEYDFGSSLAGQTVTIIFKFDYDANHSVTYGQANASNDTIMSAWINPTGSSVEGSGMSGGNFAAIWNSTNFGVVRQRIENNSTPGTAGTSSILDTTVLTGTDATFANALALTTVPEANTAILLGLAGLALLARRRR